MQRSAKTVCRRRKSVALLMTLASIATVLPGGALICAMENRKVFHRQRKRRSQFPLLYDFIEGCG